MTSEGSVSIWIERVRNGDESAAQKLWERYFADLVRFCRNKLAGGRVLVDDEEDVVLSAFDSFYRGAQEGKFPDLKDRTNLWKLLVVIAARKTNRVIQHENTLKRGGKRTVDGDALRDNCRIEDIICHELTPDLAAQVAEEYERLILVLEDEAQRSVAQLKLEGYSNREIARQLGKSERTVERKLWAIRTLWSQELQDGE